jgi:hypothetical protein
MRIFHGVTFGLMFISNLISSQSYADIAYFYVNWSCDSANRSIIIKNSLVFNDDLPPVHAVLLADVGRGNPPKRPVEVCNLGPRRIISLRGIVNEDHPRDNRLDIFIGTRPPLSVDIINANTTIQYRQKDFLSL